MDLVVLMNPNLQGGLVKRLVPPQADLAQEMQTGSSAKGKQRQDAGQG